MNSKSKILIIRFSSIGDIVLTSPVVRCLKQQKDVEIHYLTKYMYAELFKSNPYIDNVYTYDNNLNTLIQDLKKEKYDCVIDLHNNIRSFWIRYKLNVTNYTFNKENLARWLLITFRVNIIKYNVVDRYFTAVKKLNIINDGKGLDYFISKKENFGFNIDQEFIAWSIGGTYHQKRISEDQIVEVCNKLNVTVVLLGGKNEKLLAEKIINRCNNDRLHNFCGKITLDTSSYIIKNSSLLLTNDTGLMHIGTAFKIPIISFWGCTKPSLGFFSYTAYPEFIAITSSKSNYPCSRHGSYCKYTSDGCIKLISPKEIYDNIMKMKIF